MLSFSLYNNWQVLPPNVRGVVLGCALRSEGGYQPLRNLKKLAERCVKLAKKQEENMMQGEAQEAVNKAASYVTKSGELQQRATDLAVERRKFDELVDSVKEEKALLEKLEKELEVAMQKVRRVQELKGIAEESKKCAEDALTTMDAKEGAKKEGAKKEGAKKEGAENEGGEGMGGEDTEQRHKNTNVQNELCAAVKNADEQLAIRRLSLMDATSEASSLQDRVIEVRMKIESDEAKIGGSTVKRDENSLLTAIKNLERNQQKLATEQQQAAERNTFEGHLTRALMHSGSSLIGALVIGFDMESDGIASALARVFPRVSSMIDLGVHVTKNNYCFVICYLIISLNKQLP